MNDELYSLTVENGTVYLTVALAPSGQGAAADEILKECRRRGYTDLDEVMILAASSEPPPNPVAIGRAPAVSAESMPAPASAPVACLVAPDAMQAWIIIPVPKDPETPPPTESDLREALRAEGINFGVIDAAISRLAASPVYEERVLVAEGRPVEHGAHGEVEYYFETNRQFKPLVADGSGRVDHKELNLIENVLEGQLLAVKHDPRPGKPGVTVRNEYIAPEPGHPARFEPGKGAVLSEDGREIRAAESGQAIFLAGKVTVSRVYRVTGSVGPSTGNINFLGTVEITDSIEDGYSVKAEEDVIVAKTVGSVSIEAGGDVRLHGGVMGHNEAKITAGGAVSARFVQEAHIEAKGDIVVTEALLHSTVECDGRVIVGLGGKKGMIVGGQIRALTLVACRTLGSPMTTKTVVEVGRNPKLIKRFEELQAAVVLDRNNFDNIKKGLTALAAIKEKTGALPPEKEKILQTLRLAQESLKTRLQEMATELRFIQNQLRIKVKGAVSTFDTIHPGVKLMIGSVPLHVTQAEKYVTYREEEGEIKTHTYEEPKVEGYGQPKGKKKS